MANPTSNFNWQMPTASDLVTDLPADFEVFGQAVDTSLADLKGGTTGQVLSKTSGTDMDFTWVDTDDTNAIQNAIVDAKGDLIAASAADTPARLAVGNNGETLVADSSASTGLSYQANFAAGKNKIINGDFGIWQRGTSFTSIANLSYTADRFSEAHDGTGTVNVTRQAFTPGTAPVAGYEGSYFYRQAVTSSGTTTFFQTAQKIEDVTTYAGQTVKVSFWAKADSARTGLVYGDQLFGSGGSAQVQLDVNYFAMTTSWQRFSFTYSIPSIAGKTIGTGSSLAFYFRNGGTVSGATIDLWGIQVEPGSVTTAFQTATGTIQGELAACQRYYEVSYEMGTVAGTSTAEGMFIVSAASDGGSNVVVTIPLQVAKRTPAYTVSVYTDTGVSGKWLYSRSGVGDTQVTPSVDLTSETHFRLYCAVGSAWVPTLIKGQYTVSAEL
jgi:hypothetical protein